MRFLEPEVEESRDGGHGGPRVSSATFGFFRIRALDQTKYPSSFSAGRLRFVMVS